MASVAPKIPCSIDWCVKPSIANGLCSGHDARRRKGTDMDAPFRAKRGEAILVECAVPGCDKMADCGLPGAVCGAHRKMFSQRGTYERMRMAHKGKGLKCFVSSCDKPAKTRMSCNSHATRCTMYSISILQLDMMLSVGVCDLCQSASSELQIDHDHSCCPDVRSCGNCIRGVLCPPCNLGLGAFRDDANRLVAAVSYLSSR